MIQNQKIRDQIDSINWNDYESVIEFYESNQLYFENKSNFANENEIEELAHIQISYVLSLDSKKHYTKASKVLPNIDILVGKLKNTELFDEVNERYMYASGIIAQRQKKYEYSQYYFSKLIKIDPENDLYKDWYESNQEWFVYKKMKYIAYLGLFLILTVSFFADNLNIPRPLGVKLIFIGFVMLIGGNYAHKIKSFFKKLDKSKE